MATYTPVSRSVPSSQRATEITAVAAGDQIDLTDVLGRPARKVQFIMTDTSDTIDYTLNNLKKVRKRDDVDSALTTAERVYGSFGTSEVEIWSGGSSHTSFQSTGSTVLETADDLKVSSVQIDALSLSSGSTISIICW
jgi:hypothetical protein